MKKTPSMPSKTTKPRTKKTPFQLYAPEARSVALAGTFNEWDINTLPMKVSHRRDGCMDAKRIKMEEVAHREGKGSARQRVFRFNLLKYFRYSICA